MGQGRGNAGVLIVGVLLALYCCGLLALATTFTVGGSQGWTIGPNYTTWAANLTFKTGDILIFQYTKNAHDVVEVNKGDYDACTFANAITTFTDGNTSVTLNSTGTHYFLCSYPSHCTLGMKLAVTVEAGVAPAPTSVPTPASTPPPSSTPPTAPASTASPSTTSTPAATPPSSVITPPPATPPSSLITPPSGSAPPPSSAPFLPSAASLAAALLCLSAALFAF